MGSSRDGLINKDLETSPISTMHHRNESPKSSREQMDTTGELSGLTEEAMPPPAQPDDSKREHLGQADRELPSSDDQNLTELQVLSGAGSGDGRESSHLYNSGSPAALEEQKDIPESSRRDQASATEFYVVSHLVLFAILGTLSRLGVEAINTYSQAPVASPVLWANVGGSLTFGFLAEDRRLFQEEWGKHAECWSFRTVQDSQQHDTVPVEVAKKHLKIKKTIPLYIGLSTGFCGSFTSFSTFLRDAFLGLSDQLGRVPGSGAKILRNPGYRFEAVAAIIIVHVACSLSALKLGAHLALATQRFTPTLPFRFVHKYLDPAAVFLGFGCWLGAILLAIWPPTDSWRGQVIFSLVFAPTGCLFRFYLSKHLNQRKPSFPLGTFSANVSGTAALGICFIIQHSGHRSVLSCQILEGIMDGFSGCATTVSTWVGELETLERKHAYIYGVTSIVVGLVFLVVIIGSVLWSAGFSHPVCHI